MEKNRKNERGKTKAAGVCVGGEGGQTDGD